MANAEEDEYGSLFEGMDFVVEEDEEDDEDGRRSSEVVVEDGSLNHDPSPDQPIHHISNPSSLNAPALDSRDKILAAYETASAKPPAVSLPSKTADPPSILRPGIRRKKRGFKIGYGRGSDDPEEGSQVQQSLPLPIPMSAPPQHGVMATSIHALHIFTTHISSEELQQSEYVDQAATASTELSDINFDNHNDASCPKLEGGFLDVAAELATQIGPTQVEGDAFDNEDRDGKPSSVTDAKEIVSEERFENADDILDISLDIPSGSTLEERFDLLKSSLRKNLDLLQKEIGTLSQDRKVISQNRRQAAARVSNATARFKELEADLEVACEKEDFAMAESLSEELSATEKERDAASEAFRAIEIECDLTATKMQEILKLQVTLEEKGVSLIRQLEQEAVIVTEKTQKEAEERADRDLKAWATEEEALQARRNKIEMELKAVEAAKSNIQHTIDEAIQVEMEEKSVLMKNRHLLFEELENLLQMVKDKEAAIAEHDQSIKEIEEKIYKICAGFENEQSHLREEHQMVLSTYSSIEIESEYLQEKKKNVEGNMLHAQEEKLKLDIFIELAETEARTLEESLFAKRSATLATLYSREKRIGLGEKEREAEENAQALRHQASSIRASLQESTLEKANLHQNVTFAEQKLGFIEKRFPEIEAEKKLAAAARNFKEAGRLAAEAKSLLGDKETIMSDLSKTLLKLQKVEHELESQMQNLSEIEALILEKTKEAAMARCQRLRLLAAATRNERDAARELEDSLEAENLDAEAEAADNEADELQGTHGFEGEEFNRVINFEMESCHQ